MRKFIKKPLLVTLAALFVLEAWLWDVTGALIYRLIGWFPYEQLKAAITKRVEHYSPWLTLGIFIIPVLILLPLKFITLWLLAHKYWLPGVLMAIFAKLAGLGVSSFLFALCKPKLMELRFIAWLYRHCLYWRERARILVSPYMAAIRSEIRAFRALFPRSKMLEKLRAHMHTMRRQRSRK